MKTSDLKPTDDLLIPYLIINFNYKPIIDALHLKPINKKNVKELINTLTCEHEIILVKECFYQALEIKQPSTTKSGLKKLIKARNHLYKGKQ